MKRRLSMALLLPALAVLCLGQFACNQPPEPIVTAPTPEATPDTAAIEAELLRIENDWPRVMRERDGQAVRRIYAEDVHLLSWDGSVANKEEDAKFIEEGNLTFESFELSDIKVRVLDKDAAVVTGTMTMRGGKMKSKDRAIDVSGVFRFVDTFVRRDDQWKVTASSVVKVLAPAPQASPSPASSAAPAATPAPKSAPTVRPLPTVKPLPTLPVSRPSPAATVPQQ